MDAKLSARRALPPFDVCLQDLRVYMVCVCVWVQTSHPTENHPLDGDG